MTGPVGPYERAALSYFDLGWSGILPVQRSRKTPTVPGYHGHGAPYPTREQVQYWIGKFHYANLAIRLPAGFVGIDLDVYHGGGQTAADLATVHGELPPTWVSTARSDGSGVRIYRAVEPAGRRWSDRLGVGIDIVHPGNRYVMVAPSVHPKLGLPYRWFNSDGTLGDLPGSSSTEFPSLPAAWIETATKPRQVGANGLVVVAGGNGSNGSSAASNVTPKYTNGSFGTAYGIRSSESEMQRLQSAWDADNGNFNIQLNRTAFALAQLVSGGELDAVSTYHQMETLMQQLGAPADQYKTLHSGWTSGLTQPRSARKKDRTSTSFPGDLRSATTFIEYGKHEKVDGGEEGETEVVWRPWSNFDAMVTGKTRNDLGEIGEYEVEIVRDRDNVTLPATLPAKLLAKPMDLTAWLNKYEVSVLVSRFGNMTWNSRLQQYLAAQNAPVARIVPFLGWDDASGSFITFEGVLTPDGMSPFNGVRPDPKLRDQAVKYHYGFADTEHEAIQVLREVLTFQERITSSVFGAWWAACWLKGQIVPQTSMFPAMCIEAPSGHGKTRGFFELMVQLCGNQRGQAIDTTANFRDIMAGHRSGIAWQDDRDNAGPLFEILRQVTGEGTIGKKAEDRTSSVDIRLVAPVLFSGEGLGMSDQKALLDRTVQLNPPSPKGRMSLHDPSREQWVDVLAIKNRYPDLSVLAGHLGAAVLRRAHLVSALPALRSGSDGRHADKLAVLRLGARLLAEVTGDRHHVKLVDDWTGHQIDLGEQNSLTLKLIPAYLALSGKQSVPRRIDHPPFHSIPFPVLIRPDRDGTVALWVHTGLLARWWDEHQRKSVSERTETSAALADQARALGMKGNKSGQLGIDFIRVRVNEGGTANRNERLTWERVPDGIAETLLEPFTDDSDDVIADPEPTIADRVAQAHRVRRQRT